MCIWHELLATAIHAPSPHNVQPWKIKIHDDAHATLFLDTTRTLPKTDATGSFIVSAMTLFIESLAIVAANHSHQLTHQLLSGEDEGSLRPFAYLTVRQVTPVATGYPDALFFKRRTSRLPLLPGTIPDQAVRRLADLAASWGQTYRQISDRAQIERIMERNIQALFVDMNTSSYYEELAPWFRFTRLQARRTHDGLDYRCMNLPRAEFWMAAKYPQLLRSPLTRPLMRRIYRYRLGPVPTIGVVSGPFWDRASALNAGPFLARFWLELSRHDLYIHPLGNLVTNRQAAEWLAQEVQLPQIWFVFKIGFSREPPKSQRKPVEDVILA